MDEYISCSDIRNENTQQGNGLSPNDIPTARLREFLECKAGSGTPLNLMMQNM